jgi:hypothetical protein
MGPSSEERLPRWMKPRPVGPGYERDSLLPNAGDVTIWVMIGFAGILLWWGYVALKAGFNQALPVVSSVEAIVSKATSTSAGEPADHQGNRQSIRAAQRNPRSPNRAVTPSARVSDRFNKAIDSLNKELDQIKSAQQQTGPVENF